MIGSLLLFSGDSRCNRRGGQRWIHRRGGKCADTTSSNETIQHLQPHLIIFCSFCRSVQYFGLGPIINMECKRIRLLWKVLQSSNNTVRCQRSNGPFQLATIILTVHQLSTSPIKVKPSPLPVLECTFFSAFRHRLGSRQRKFEQKPSCTLKRTVAHGRHRCRCMTWQGHPFCSR